MKKSSLLKQYALKALGLSLLTCLLLSGLLYLLSAHYLNREAETAAEQELEGAAQDFSDYLETLTDMANHVKVEMYYRPFLVRDAYNRVLLLERFGMFRTWHPLISDYYLYYPSEQIVFTPEFTYTWKLFSEKMPHGAVMASMVREAEEEETKLYADGENLYLFFPIRFPYTNHSAQAYLTVVTAQSALRERFARLYHLDRTLEMQWDGVVILAGDTAEKRVVCSAETAAGTLTLSVKAIPSEMETEWSWFRAAFGVAILAMVLLSAILSVVIAVSIYRPIYQLAQKSGIPVEDSRNEIVTLERHIEALRTDKQDAMSRLVENAEAGARLTDELRRVILLRLLEGESGEMLEDAPAMGLDLRYACYKTFYLPWDAETADEALRDCIENYRTGLVVLYTVRLPDQHGWCIIACAGDRMYFDDLEDELERRLMEQGIAIPIYSGTICVRLQELAQSLLYAQNTVHEDSLRKNRHYTDQLLEYLRNGEREEAETCLKNIFQNLNSNIQSNLIYRTCVAELFGHLQTLARELHCDIGNVLLPESVMAGDPGELHASMQALADAICAGNETNDDSFRDERGIVAYIRQHAYENSISLDSIAAEFGISTRHLTRLIRVETGTTFKELLTRLRLEKAAALAEEGVSTAEISERIGYADKQYFVKLFRQQMGCTPSQYRSRTGRGARAEQ